MVNYEKAYLKLWGGVTDSVKRLEEITQGISGGGLKEKIEREFLELRKALLDAENIIISDKN